MPITDRQIDGRSLTVIEDSVYGEASSYAEVPHKHTPNTDGVIYDRYVPDIRQQIQARDSGRVLATGTPQPVTNNQTEVPVVTAPSQPFGQTLSSYFGGGASPRNYDQPIAVVPTEGSSGSNTGLILLIVGVTGVGIWYYYKHGGF